MDARSVSLHILADDDDLPDAEIDAPDEHDVAAALPLPGPAACGHRRTRTQAALSPRKAR
eukprot:1618793-Pleurochrysis_carterae.AAC.2